MRAPEQPSRVILAVVNLKGGTAKTTSAAFLAHALHETGWRVLGVDADPQRSLLDWSAESPAGWPFPVVGLATRMLARDLGGITGDHNAVVIDTPPLEEQAGIVRAALLAATHVVVPVARPRSSTAGWRRSGRRLRSRRLPVRTAGRQRSPCYSPGRCLGQAVRTSGAKPWRRTACTYSRCRSRAWSGTPRRTAMASTRPVTRPTGTPSGSCSDEPCGRNQGEAPPHGRAAGAYGRVRTAGRTRAIERRSRRAAERGSREQASSRAEEQASRGAGEQRAPIFPGRARRRPAVRWMTSSSRCCCRPRTRRAGRLVR